MPRIGFVMSNTNRILDEHFWFTATTLGFNAFVISSDQQERHRHSMIIISGVISALALFLIVDRFAAHAKRQRRPDQFKAIPFEQYSLKDLAMITLYRMKRFFPNLIFAIAECSGSLFYILLVTASWLAVLFGK
jgi:hypothetical protein